MLKTIVISLLFFYKTTHPYIEKVKPVKVEPVAPVEKTKIKKKPQPLQEIYMDKGFDEDEGDIA